ncbi:hypothetical protein QQM39_10220 [Streptomyces sp. DT2A-34]|nr:hypothetical protein [Streptomyces sp. DT2A-34]MDO0911217.1 hypothetical protein [Streptomyces sp. DT2A-34]
MTAAVVLAGRIRGPGGRRGACAAAAVAAVGGIVTLLVMRTEKSVALR